MIQSGLVFDHIREKLFTINVRVVVQCQCELFQAVAALRPPSGRTRLLHCRQQQRNQNGNDGNHDQELNQRKSGVRISAGASTEAGRKTGVNRHGHNPMRREFGGMEWLSGGSLHRADATFPRSRVNDVSRQVFWLPDHPDSLTFPRFRSGLARAVCPRLQRRDRDGFTPSSLFIRDAFLNDADTCNIRTQVIVAGC